ncbi:hypothetical protein Tco_0576075 [Tanacetum coccineum]
MIEPKPVKKLSKKDQLKLDEEVAQRLQAKFDEQERIEREKAEANIALKETWDDIHAKIKADQEKKKTLCSKKSIREKEQTTNKSSTKEYHLVKESSKKADAEIAQESSSKRAGDELEQESIKKQKVDEDKKTAELKSLMEVIPDEEEVALDAIPLATKPPTIVDWKIHKEGKKSYYQIIRVDGSSKMYLVFSYMLKSFDREDLETLYKLVKAKYGSTRPVEDLDLVLYGDLKTMFDPHGNLQIDLHDQGVIDSGCSRHMTGNISYLTDYEEIDGGYVAFCENLKGGKITGKRWAKRSMKPTIRFQHVVSERVALDI